MIDVDLVDVGSNNVVHCHDAAARLVAKVLQATLAAVVGVLGIRIAADALLGVPVFGLRGLLPLDHVAGRVHVHPLLLVSFRRRDDAHQLLLGSSVAFDELVLVLLLAILSCRRIRGRNVIQTSLVVLAGQHDAVEVHLARLLPYFLAVLLPVFVLLHTGALFRDHILDDLQLLAVGVGPVHDCLRIERVGPRDLVPYAR